MFLILFCIMFKADTSSTFLWNRKKYFRRRQAFTSYPTQLPQVWGKCWLSQISTLWCQVLVKMLTFTIINTMMLGVGVMVPYAMVDVINIVIVCRCYAYYCGICCCLNLVLWCDRWWPTEADIITSFLNNGRCYSHVADGMATLGWDYFSLKSGIKQNLIPYVRQMVFTYVLIQGWIAELYIYI